MFRTSKFWFLALAVPAMLCLLPAQARGQLTASRAVPQGFMPEERKSQIDWKADWDATYAATSARWRAELETAEKDGTRRQQRLCARTIHLLESLMARWPDPARHTKALVELAGQLEALGFRSQAQCCRKQVIDANPGQLALAVAQLQAILQSVCGREAVTQDAQAWIEYAATRLMSLRQAGLIEESHPAMDWAWRGQVALAMARGDFLGGWEAAAKAAEHHPAWLGLSLQWQGNMLQAAGRFQEALDFYTRSLALTDDNGLRMAIDYIQKGTAPTTPMFGRAMGLEMRWEGLRKHPPSEQIEALTSLIQESAGNPNFTSQGGERFESVWSAVDQYLQAQKPAELAELRKVNQAEAAEYFAETPAGDYARILRGFRRFPWAPQGHQALVQAGQQAMREGKAGWAVRAFRDVLSHSADAAVLGQARVGLRLAEGPTTAPASAGLALKDLRPLVLEFSGPNPWPAEALESLGSGVRSAFPAVHGQLQSSGDSVLLSGPNLLACYTRGAKTPRWLWTNELSCGLFSPNRDERAMPGTFLPAISGGKVISRWGLLAGSGQPASVAAFDLAGGAMLWSTAGDAQWAGLGPCSDPVVADGKVYVLAMPWGSFVPASLLCLDAQGGATLWKRTLATQNVGLAGPDGQANDVPSRYGNAVAVHQGQVYCLTNLGYVVKADARDGMLLWAQTYDRAVARDASSFARLCRRLGSTPIIAGGLCILAPRDRGGVFALDAQTGLPAWDCPLAPSEDVVGLAEGLLVVRDRFNLAAVDVATGKSRWRTYWPERIVGQPRLAGDSVCLVTGTKLCRLSSQTGAIVEEMNWPLAEAPRQVLPTGDVLAAVTVRSVVAGQPGLPGPVAQGPPLVTAERRATAGSALTSAVAGPPPGPLSLPLRPAWVLRRIEPELRLPPAEAGDSSVYLLSGGVLERVHMPSGTPAWSMLVPPAPKMIEWSGGLMILGYTDRAVAIDVATGQQKWETVWPMEAANGVFLAGQAIVAWRNHGNGAKLAVADLATGKLLWSSPLAGFLTDHSVRHVYWDGQNLHLFHQHGLYNQGLSDLVLRPSDGEVVSNRNVGPIPRHILSVGTRLFTINAANLLTMIGPDGKRVEFPTPLAHEQLGELTDLKVDGPWVRVQFLFTYRGWICHNWVFKLDDPTYSFYHRHLAWVQDNTIFLGGGNHKLRAVDLPSKKPLLYTTMHLGPPLDMQIPINTWSDGKLLWIAWSNRYNRPYVYNWPETIQLDCYDRASGARLGGQDLPEASQWFEGAGGDTRMLTRVVQRGGLVLVLDADGLHAYSPGQAPEPAPLLAYRPNKPVAADGFPQNWDDALTVDMVNVAGRAGVSGKLSIAHDDARVFLSARYTSPTVRARRGADEFGGGHRLEIALTTPGNRSPARWMCGPNEAGEFIIDGPAGNRPPGVTGQMRHDLATGQVNVDVSVPKALLGYGHPGEILLSAAVWADDGGTASHRLLEWGAGMRGRALDHRRMFGVELRDNTRGQEQAEIAFARGSLDVNACFELVCRALPAYFGDGEPLVRACAEILKANPQSPRCLKFMEMMDSALRGPATARSAVTGDGQDPSGRVLQLARQAGVKEETCALYARQAGPYLSQWVYVEAPPTWLAINFHDGKATTGSISWGNPGGTRIMYAGDVPARGQWVELRVPLIWVGVHEHPITQITLHHDQGKVYWDRTAYVVDGLVTAERAVAGKETVLLDEDESQGKLTLPHQWVSPLVTAERAVAGPEAKSGSKALMALLGGWVNNPRWEINFAPTTPLTAHVVTAPPVGKPSAGRADQIIASMKGLGASNLAWVAFQQLMADEDHARRAAMCIAFAKLLPDHPQIVNVLSLAHGELVLSSTPKVANDTLMALVDSLPLDPKAIYQFRRGRLNTLRHYIGQFQVLGPLPVGKEPSPAGDGVVLDKTYAGLAGKARWQSTPIENDGFLRLGGAVGSQPATAYAACWVYSDTPAKAVLELSLSSTGAVWLNGRSVFTGRAGSLEAGREMIELSLPAGWSSLLIRCDSSQPWGLRAELVEPGGTGMGQMKVSHLRPDAQSSRV